MTPLTAYETLHRSGADLPAVPFTPYSQDVKIKLLRVDPVSGQLCVILSAPGGTGLGAHKHYGSVMVYTIKGAWRYLEHDWVARAGDFVYETAGSSHTFMVEPGETTEAFIIVEGELLHQSGQSHRDRGLADDVPALSRLLRAARAAVSRHGSFRRGQGRLVRARRHLK